MDLPQFRRRLAALGADLAAWPAADAEAAIALMSASTTAQDLFAQRVGEDLRSAGAPEQDTTPLVEKILAATRAKS
jgi:hypothetical protein